MLELPDAFGSLHCACVRPRSALRASRAAAVPLLRSPTGIASWATFVWRLASGADVAHYVPLPTGIQKKSCCSIVGAKLLLSDSNKASYIVAARKDQLLCGSTTALLLLL